MFRNPGGKIKSYAKVLFWIGVVISIIIGVIEIGSSFVAAAYSYQGSFGTILLGILGGILTVAIGTLISWLAVLTLYAFGTLVENSDELVRLNGGIPSGDKTAEKIEVPEKMHQTLHNIQTEPVVKATPEKQTEEPVEEVKEEPASEVVDAPAEETSTADEKTVEENADFPMDPSCQERTYEEIRMLPLEIIAQSAGNSEPLKNPQKIR